MKEYETDRVTICRKPVQGSLSVGRTFFDISGFRIAACAKIGDLVESIQALLNKLV